MSYHLQDDNDVTYKLNEEEIVIWFTSNTKTKAKLRDASKYDDNNLVKYVQLRNESPVFSSTADYFNYNLTYWLFFIYNKTKKKRRINWLIKAIVGILIIRLVPIIIIITNIVISIGNEFVLHQHHDDDHRRQSLYIIIIVHYRRCYTLSSSSFIIISPFYFVKILQNLQCKYEINKIPFDLIIYWVNLDGIPLRSETFCRPFAIIMV